MCRAPVRVDMAARPGASPQSRLRGYSAVLQQCRNLWGDQRLAIRKMNTDAGALLLTVDPQTLATRLEPEACWTCVDTSDDAQASTRFMRAVHVPDKPAAARASFLRNAGLVHGGGEGSYITGDLCPAIRPLDRAFIDRLEKLGPKTPVALAISGLWLTRHAADFQYLRERAQIGALDITWVNHSFHHPFVPGRDFGRNFLLTPGVDAQAEILDTEKLLIARGETPSVFFRFPGLISDAALMDAVRRNHLVSLGADGWLVFAAPLRPGAILLVHPNGNEPAGLRLFSKMLDKNLLPRPFRAINEAP